MSVVRAISRHRKVLASALGIAVLAGIPVTFAVLHQGFPVSDVDLNAKDVWVTNGHSLLGGRLNRQIEELSGAVSAQSSDLDVVQNGESVFLFEPSRGSIARVDPAYTNLVEPAEMPIGSTVALGGDTLAIVSPDGKLWAVDIANGLTFDPTQRPAANLGKGGQAVVTSGGAVIAVSQADQKLYRIEQPGATPVEHGLAVAHDAQLSAAGDHAVLYDPSQSRLERDDGSTIALPGKALQLQQSGADGDRVALATGNSLYIVALSSGTVTTVSADLAEPVRDAGQVSRPVVVDGCAHGAWAGAQRYLLACTGQKPNVQDIDQATQGKRLEFRVNRDVVALNDLDTGNVWLLDDQMRLVNNWDQVTPPQEDDTTDGNQKASTQSFEDTLADRTNVNRPPIARDDDFGVRPGRTTVLPVLDNDTDPDGDVLTIPRFTPIPDSTGTIDVIDGGRALQFTPAEGATAASFRYTVDDGREGGVAEAAVTIRIVPLSDNTAPVAKRQTAVSVENGGQVSYNVLADWIDPDGDDIYLDSATPTSADQVRFTPDGFITFESKSGDPGTKEVQFTVSDGKLSAQGTLEVTVEPAGKLGPVGTPDFAQVFRGQTVAVSPLANDTSPNGQPLTLLGVTEVPAGATVTPNLERGTVTFSSPTVGTYYFKYQLAAGAASSVGLVRVDVLPDPDAPAPPIAVKDTAFLRAGEPTSVKVLLNDVSPDGKVLAVQSVDTSTTDPAVSVEVLSNAVIRITSSSALAEQTQFRYTISDGTQTSTAGVTIVPVPPIVNRQPPVAIDDRVRVRAGDFVSADVLANDFHPDQGQLILEPELADTSQEGDGLAFVGDGKVRYQAGNTPGEYSVVYRITDQYGETATARVSFVVVAPDEKNDQDPVPVPQTARVFAGATVPITIPLDGIDPDGDSVVIDGIESAPQLGTITASSQTGFEYKANDSAAGTDTFTYRVEDSYGRKAIGTITIGVIPRPDTVAPPNAVDDSVTMKPGRTATVQVLLNDSDPSGYSLSLDPKLVEVDSHLQATVDRSKIVVVAPKTEGTYAIRYGISNGHGGTDTAFLQVKVSQDAPPVYPTAIDYYVPATDMVGKSSVPVKLQDLIANPGGRDEDLKISVEGANADLASVDQASQTVTVSPGDRRTAIAYRVTNPDDGLTATAFIVVPPKQTGETVPPPYLDPKLPPQVIDMNAEKSWKLSDILIVPSKKPAILIDTDSITAPNSDGSKLFAGNDTVHYKPRAGFRGQTTIVFKVTDGTSADDPNGHEALISLPVTVGDPNQLDLPPTFSALSLQIEAGEAATVRDLRDATDHPNPSIDKSQFAYGGLTGTTDDIQAALSGSQLSVSAPLGVQPGAHTTLHVTIKYRSFTVPATINVEVVSSSRPRTQANEDDAKGQRGKTDTVNVLTNDTNPFPEQPLRLTGAVIENAAESNASISYTANGDVTIRPGALFIGVVSVLYTVRDGTKDPSRDVTGRLQYTVRDVPGKPNPPTFVEGDQAVTVQWEAPATNGETIDHYTIACSGTGCPASTSVAGTAATHTFNGLSNSGSYVFRVTAHNVLGDGQVSDASATAKPFGAPSPVTTATATGTNDGSGGITLNWSGASGNGRDITGYRIQPSTGGSPINVGAVNRTTIPGQVGRAAGYTIVALNEGGKESAPTTSQNQGTPLPAAPSSASASWSGNRGDHTVTFSWGAATSNQPISNYHITVSDGQQFDMGTATSKQISGNFGQAYSFTVTATSNGATSAGRTSNSVTPLDVQPFEIHLCYGGPLNVGNRLGVTWTNMPGGSHHITFSGFLSSIDVNGGGSGSATSGAYAARDTAGDLAHNYTFAYDGQSHTENWGAAPPC